MVKMVKDITSLSRNGMSDWLIQRVSSVIILLYIVILAGFFINHPHLDYISWHWFFAQTWMHFASILFFLSLFVHAWVGMWTIGTDYLVNAYIRLAYQLLIIFVSAAYLFYGIHILWGN